MADKANNDRGGWKNDAVSDGRWPFVNGCKVLNYKKLGGEI